MRENAAISEERRLNEIGLRHEALAGAMQSPGALRGVFRDKSQSSRHTAAYLRAPRRTSIDWSIGRAAALSMSITGLTARCLSKDASLVDTVYGSNLEFIVERRLAHSCPRARKVKCELESISSSLDPH